MIFFPSAAMSFLARAWGLRLAGCLLLAGCAMFSDQRYDDFRTATPLPDGCVLVLCIPGGIEPWDDAYRGVGRLAARLRSLHVHGMHVETVENRRLGLAQALILNAFDRNGDLSLDRQEAARVRIILVGHSMGAAAVVRLARDLKERDLPVLLSIQVDSFGGSDDVIPANVKRAVNFYQTDGIFVRGEDRIVAEDPRATDIMGNYRYDYSGDPVDMSAQPFIRRLFNTPHDQMAADPVVWDRVEDLILRSAIHHLARSASIRP